MRFVCEKCKYEMERESAPERCPYCGERGTIIRKKTAQDILNEIDEA